MTEETLRFFVSLLGRTSISAAAPDFEEQARLIIQARLEIDEALAAYERAAAGAECGACGKWTPAGEQHACDQAHVAVP